MSASVRAGDQIAGRYDLVELLAETPAGWWLRALDREVEVEVGLLALRAELVPDQDRRDQLLGAFVAVRGIGHRHLLRLFDAGPIDTSGSISGSISGSVYVTAQLGRPCAPPATPAAVVAYAGAVAEALEALHHAGQVHGRLAPGDIVMTSGLIKVMGGGLYQALRPALAMSFWGQEARFWAPEVVRGQAATPAADVFSLAAIAAELLAGEPGDVAGAMSVLAARARALHDVLEPALSPALDARPASPGVLAGRLAAALDEDEHDSAPTMYFARKSGDPANPLVAGEGAPGDAAPSPPVRPSSGRPPTEDPDRPALQFVSMKPPSEQGARRTPVIPAIDKPEMTPKIRALSRPRAATAQPGSLGRYAPPRDETRARRRTPTWVYMIAAALSSATLAVALTLALYGGSDEAGAAPDAASVADASAPGVLAARPMCAAGLLLVEQGDLVYCIEPHDSPGEGAIPQVPITLAEAQAACQARGRRLCTEIERERACGGELGGGAARDPSDARCSRSEQHEGPQRAYPDAGFRCCAAPAHR